MQEQLLFESATASYITTFVFILYQTCFLNTKQYGQSKENLSASEEWPDLLIHFLLLV